MVTTGSKRSSSAAVLPTRKPRALIDFLSSRAKTSIPQAPPFPHSLLWRSAASRWPSASRPSRPLRNGAVAGRTAGSNNDCLWEEIDARRCLPAATRQAKRPHQQWGAAAPDGVDKDASERGESVCDWDSESSLEGASKRIHVASSNNSGESAASYPGPEKHNALRPASEPLMEPHCASGPSQGNACNGVLEAKRASLYEELIELRGSAETSIVMFPDYFNSEEKQLVSEIAQELELGCQIGDKSTSVFKLHQSASGPPSHIVARLRSSTIRAGACIPTNNGAHAGAVHGGGLDDVYVDLAQLAQQGQEGFASQARLRRFNSGSGVRRALLWDVAQLSSSSDVVADRVADGQGGVYAVQSRSSGQKLVLFKPAEEERFVRDGLSCGEGAVREEAAYVLDSRASGFSGVPPTAVARLKLSTHDGSSKHGSVQRFMSSSVGSMESFGMPFDLAKAQAFAPVEQVHRIAILDVRVFNTDRHHGNILLIGDKPPFTMVPIDHGCILPSWFHLSEARFDWLEYPQSRVPFSPVELAYIEALDAEGDAAALRRLGIREECVTTMRICTLFLQLAARHGKTLHWIGTFMQRSGCFEDASAFERVVERACAAAGVPFALERNEFGEEKSRVSLGVLSRRPPSRFVAALQQLLLEEVTAGQLRESDS